MRMRAVVSFFGVLGRADATTQHVAAAYPRIPRIALAASCSLSLGTTSARVRCKSWTVSRYDMMRLLVFSFGTIEHGESVITYLSWRWMQCNYATDTTQNMTSQVLLTQQRVFQNLLIICQTFQAECLKGPLPAALKQ